MPGEDLAQLRAIWQAAGRPGVFKFRHAVQRAGLNLTVKKAADFVHGEATAQVFAPAPKSEGKIGSPQLNERWHAGLIDLKSKTPEKNDGNRLALVVIDIFSRFLWAEPLPTKEPEAVAAAFQSIQRAARGRVRQKAGALPVELSTDSGAEFKGVFSEMLAKQGVAQRFKEQTNLLGVVDAAIRTLKEGIAKEMLETGSDSWSKALPLVVKS